MMKRCMRYLFLAAIISPSLIASTRAAEPAPVLLVMDDIPRIEPNPDPGERGSGILLDWATASINKDNVAAASALRTALPQLDLPSLAAKAFECLGRADASQQCLPVVLASSTPADLDKAIAEQKSPHVFIVRLTLKFSLGFYEANLNFIEIDQSTVHPENSRSFAIAYVTAAPQAIRDDRKTNAGALNKFWTAGTPSRLESEVHASLREIRQILDWRLTNNAVSEALTINLSKPNSVHLVQQSGEASASSHNVSIPLHSTNWMKFH